MRKVFLLTGFQNWGKTRLIKELFEREMFRRDDLYPFGGYDFCVMPQSNDDLGKSGYERTYAERMRRLHVADRKDDYIFSAFCPTIEPNNRSDDIIKNLYSKDEVILIPIEYKWCNHAKLQLDEIKQFYEILANINITIKPLSQNDPKRKLQDLKNIVRLCLP